MGGGFCIKAVTRYAVLYDVHVFLLICDSKSLLKKNLILFFCFGRRAEGLGVNAQNPKLLILFEGGARGELKG